MVKAILDGRKTMTRRVMKPQPEEGAYLHHYEDDGIAFANPCVFHKYRYVVGDRLWVRETFQIVPPNMIFYKTDPENKAKTGWKPSIFMPRCASRITLEITNVRVERLQDISAPDCVNEGINTQGPYDVAIYDEFSSHSIAQFAYLWDSINSKKYPWASNPWVFAIEFKRVENKL
jgi:hypothetical protein